MAYISKVKDTPIRSRYYIGFNRGLNTIQSINTVHDRNLTVALNAQLEVDGVGRRPGSTKVWDEGGATKVYAAIDFKRITTGDIEKLRMAKVGSKVRLQKLNESTEKWEDVSTSIEWEDAQAHMLQVYDRIYIFNGTDKLRYYDGSGITTYTEISTPTGLTVTAKGTTGSTTYSYRVEALNNTGRTAACARVTITNGNETLSTSNYNELTWNAVSGADAYNVYGRTPTGAEEQYLATVYTNSYKDTGVDVPVDGFQPNEYNTTGGIIAKKAIFALGRMFAIGVTEGTTYYPTRLYYSGTVQYVDAFVGGDYGGGWVEVQKNDGGEIVDIVEFQGDILVMKTNGIYKFYFTDSGLPALKHVESEHGALSPRGGQLIGNDLVFVGRKDNRIVIVTIGQQQNYVGDQLRTNDISIFISDETSNINQNKVEHISTWSYDYKFGVVMPGPDDIENSVGYVLDVRFGGWVKWDGLPTQATSYALLTDSTGSQFLYGCSHSDGYMIRLFEDNRNDNGESFTTKVSTKSFNMDMYDVEKIFRNPSVWFASASRDPVDIYIGIDGEEATETMEITSTGTGAYVGATLVGQALPGGAYNTLGDTEEVKSDLPQVAYTMLTGRSIRFTVHDDTLNSNWLFMGVHVSYIPLVGKPLAEVYRLSE